VSSIIADSRADSAFSFDLDFAFDFSDFSVFDERLNIALKVGALGFNFGIVDLDDCGRVPMTPTGGGDDSGRNSSSSAAILVDRADVDPC
jgi:hypothetical protein